MLVDNFKGHSTNIVKEHAKSFKSGNNSDDEEDRCKLINFLIIDRSITPKAQLLDLFLGQIIKGLTEIYATLI